MLSVSRLRSRTPTTSRTAGARVSATSLGMKWNMVWMNSLAVSRSPRNPASVARKIRNGNRDRNAANAM